ncbi:MAG: DNA-protecting protein DprA [Bacteroidales bacterium]|nr:DNA-protecting protein DprA [Bacteroidales bacterium]
MMNIEDNAYICALNRIFGFKPKIGLTLISQLGSAQEIFRLSHKEKAEVLGTHSRFVTEICMKRVEEAAEELHALERQGITFLGYTDENYPRLLQDCDDPPIGLYIRSVSPHKDIFNRSRPISVIGTRDISPYGKEWCERIVAGLAACKEKPCIISGLALGTDICAHRSALENGLPTIAVMATGPEDIYPYRHRSYAERIAATPGCALITDYPPGTPALPVHFLRRNRIIAGLSEATLLIESKIKGGGMMTARLAFSYNRDVYALPGRIDDTMSQGCNLLIREKKAEALTDMSSFINNLRLSPERQFPGNGASHMELTSLYGSRLPDDRIVQMSEILITIRKNRGIMLEDLACSIKTDYRRVAELAGILESDGLIEMDLLQRCFISHKR